MGLWHQRVEPSIRPLPRPLPKSLPSTRTPRYAHNRIRSLFNLTETKRIATQITSKKGANRSRPAPPSLPQVAEAAPQTTKTVVNADLATPYTGTGPVPAHGKPDTAQVLVPATPDPPRDGSASIRNSPGSSSITESSSSPERAAPRVKKPKGPFPYK